MTPIAHAVAEQGSLRDVAFDAGAGGVTLSAREREAVDGMLADVIEHWKALRDTSVAELRDTILMREGRLEHKDDSFGPAAGRCANPLDRPCSAFFPKTWDQQGKSKPSQPESISLHA